MGKYRVHVVAVAAKSDMAGGVTAQEHVQKPLFFSVLVAKNEQMKVSAAPHVHKFLGSIDQNMHTLSLLHMA